VASNELVEIRVPDIGNYKDVEVIDVSVKAGDSIAIEGALITLETEKATMDVPSTAAGVIREMKVQRGSRVSQGDVIAIVEVTSPAAAGSTSPAKAGSTSPASAGEVARSAGEGPVPGFDVCSIRIEGSKRECCSGYARWSSPCCSSR